MKGKTAQYDSSLLPALSQQMNACGFRHDLKKKKKKEYGFWSLRYLNSITHGLFPHNVKNITSP